MTSDAIASAGIHPVVTITIAATMTTAEPMRSPSTSRYAPRTLMLRRCAALSSHIATRVRDEADDRDDEHQPAGHLDLARDP